mmetsp:Transcript_36199/g.82254  ORF Transcript_36199/g.82254 Transcript_36199/m.82254 type:complete len:261 (+) Transcript_36199:1253-2035(+)
MAPRSLPCPVLACSRSLERSGLSPSKPRNASVSTTSARPRRATTVLSSWLSFCSAAWSAPTTFSLSSSSANSRDPRARERRRLTMFPVRYDSSCSSCSASSRSITVRSNAFSSPNSSSRARSAPERMNMSTSCPRLSSAWSTTTESLCSRNDVRDERHGESPGLSGLRRPQSMDATESDDCIASWCMVPAFALTDASTHCSPSASNTALASLRHSSSSTFTDCSATSLQGLFWTARQKALTAPGTSTTLRAVESTCTSIK